MLYGFDCDEGYRVRPLMLSGATSSLLVDGKITQTFLSVPGESTPGHKTNKISIKVKRIVWNL